MLDRRLDEDEKTTIPRPQRQFDEKADRRFDEEADRRSDENKKMTFWKLDRQLDREGNQKKGQP